MVFVRGSLPCVAAAVITGMSAGGGNTDDVLARIHECGLTLPTTTVPDRSRRRQPGQLEALAANPRRGTCDAASVGASPAISWPAGPPRTLRRHEAGRPGGCSAAVTALSSPAAPVLATADWSVANSLRWDAWRPCSVLASLACLSAAGQGPDGDGQTKHEGRGTLRPEQPR